jgi:hypothetical protein
MHPGSPTNSEGSPAGYMKQRCDIRNGEAQALSENTENRNSPNHNEKPRSRRMAPLFLHGGREGQGTPRITARSTGFYRALARELKSLYEKKAWCRGGEGATRRPETRCLTRRQSGEYGEAVDRERVGIERDIRCRATQLALGCRCYRTRRVSVGVARRKRRDVGMFGRWYVPTTNLLAIIWSTDAPTAYGAIEDQTVWHIQHFREGYFFGPLYEICSLNS